MVRHSVPSRFVVPEDVWLSSIESREEKGVRHMSIKDFQRHNSALQTLYPRLSCRHNFYDVEIVFVQKRRQDISLNWESKDEMGMKIKFKIQDSRILSFEY